jgi:hypothetical protein
MEPFTDQSESTDVSMPEDVKASLVNEANEKISQEFGGKIFSEDDISGEFYREETNGFGYAAIDMKYGIEGTPHYFGARYNLSDTTEKKQVEILPFENVVDEILKSHNLTEARSKREPAILHSVEGLIVRVTPDPINKYKDHYIVIPNESNNPKEKEIYATPVSADQIK